MKDAKIDHVFITTMHRDTLRAPEANEMLERAPNRLLRMGMWAVVMLFAMMLFISVFIKYPDTLEGSAIITTDPLPIKLKSPSGGRITSLFVQDGSIVRKDEVIAEIENPTGYENIRKLKSTVDSINFFLQRKDDGALATFLDHPLQSLGDGQSFYNNLLQQISAKLLLQKEHLYSKRTENLEQQIGKLQSIAYIADTEKGMIEQELKEADERFSANEKLYQEKVISRQEYYDEAAKLRQKKLQLDQQNSSIIQNKVNSGESNKQMLEIQYDQEEKEMGFTVSIEAALRNIQNYMQTWRQRYLITAPFTGTVSYLMPVQVNAPTNAGDEVFAVIPSEHKYSAIIMLPAAGIGKIEIGQKVHVMVDNFPYSEFGFLEGSVIKRSSMEETGGHGATQSAMYRVYVKLNDTLETNYHKRINFSPEMTADARIITNDRNLLQRLISGMTSSAK